RAAICANHSFRRRRFSCSLSGRACGHGLCWRFSKPRQSDDYRLHYVNKGKSMKDRLTRRKLITTGLAAAGASGLVAAARLADRYGLIPPDHGGIYGAGETLTYAAQRILTGQGAPAREFSRSDISKVFPVNGEPPDDDRYQELLDGHFANWRLTVDGLV